MLQVPPTPTVVVPSTVVPSWAYKVMVSPGVPVPLIAGLAFLVRLSVALMPVSFTASCVRLATGAAGKIIVDAVVNVPRSPFSSLVMG